MHVGTTDWERELTELLDELSELQDELLDILRTKQTCMTTGDLPGMQRLQMREAELAGRLQECHDRRAALLTEAKTEGLPADSLGKLASAVTGTGRSELHRRVHQASTRMRLLQHHSLANWVLAQRTLLHVSQLLEIIATGGRQRPTYGTDHTSRGRGALVDRTA